MLGAPTQSGRVPGRGEMNAWEFWIWAERALLSSLTKTGARAAVRYLDSGVWSVDGDADPAPGATGVPVEAVAGTAEQRRASAAAYMPAGKG